MKATRRDDQNATKRNTNYDAKHLETSQPVEAAKRPGQLLRKARIVFFGNERLATGVSTSAPTLRALIEAGYEVAAVVTNYSEATSRTSRELEVRTIAAQYTIPVIIPENLADNIEEIKKYKADCGVLVAFGKMVSDEVIHIFPKGIINVHPSLLPKHRGPTPIESVILGGSTVTGVSIMKLVKAMDAGPVYAQTKVSLNGSETKQELANTFAEIGSKLVLSHLPDILSGKLEPTPQNESEASYDSLITKLDGAIDWNLRAETIEQQIRAYSGWPGSRTELLGKEVIVIKAEITDKTGIPGEVLTLDKQLTVCCGTKAITILSLKPAGKNEMTGQAFIAGYGKHLKS